MQKVLCDPTTGFGTALGQNTVANCNKGAPVGEGGACTATGYAVNNTEGEALVNSGNIHAKNIKLFGSDARLSTNATDVDPAALLQNVERLRVVERAPSANYCLHQRRDPAACARDRTVALLAQQVGAVVPGAVGSGASLTLMDSAKADRTADRARAPVLEEVEALQGLDVHALLAQLVGAVQALSTELKAVVEQKDAEIAALQEAVRGLKARL